MRYARATGFFLAVIALHVALSLTACGQEHKKGDQVVAQQDADLKRGTDKVGAVEKGDKLDVEQVQGNWLLVRKGEARGWLNIRNVAGASRSASVGRELITLTGPRVAIYNLVGNVDIVRGDGDAVEVDVQRGGRDGARLRVAKGDIDGRQTLRVIYPANVVVTPAAVFRGITTMQVRQDGTFGGGTGPTQRDVVIMGLQGVVSPVPSGPRLEAYAHVIVRVPKSRDVSVHLGAGTISARDVEADVTLHNCAGDVAATGTRGTLAVVAEAGDVTADDGNGELQIDAEAGNVSVHTMNGVLAVNAEAGDVLLSQVQAPRVRIKSDAGNVRAIEMRAPSVDVRADAGDVKCDLMMDVDDLMIDADAGNVTVQLQKDTGAQIELDAEAGEIAVKVPITTTVSREETVRGTVGDGRGRVKIHAGAGDIRLSSR